MGWIRPSEKNIFFSISFEQLQNLYYRCLASHQKLILIVIVRKMCVKHILFAIVIISLEEKLPGGQFYRKQKWEYLTQRLKLIQTDIKSITTLLIHFRSLGKKILQPYPLYQEPKRGKIEKEKQERGRNPPQQSLSLSLV